MKATLPLLLGLFVLLSFVKPVFSQLTEQKGIPPHQNYFSVYLMPMLMAKPEITLDSGSADPWNRTYSAGIAAGSDYTIRLGNQWVMTAGADLGFYYYSFRYSLKASDYPELQGYDYDNNCCGMGRSGNVRLQLPLTLGKDFSLPGKSMIRPYLGLNYSMYNSYSFSYEETALYGDDTIGISMLGLTTETEGQMVNFNAGVAYSFVLPNANLLQFDLRLNYSPTDPVQGQYTLLAGTPHETHGKYSLSGTSLGFRIAYAMTRTRKIADTKKAKDLGYASLLDFRVARTKAKRATIRSLDPKEFHKKNAVEGSAGLNLMVPARYEIQGGHDKPLTYVTVGYQFGLGYLLNFNTSNGLYVGTSIRTMRDNYDVHLDPDPPQLNNTIDLEGWSTTYWNLLGLNLEWEHRLFGKNPAHWWVLQGGVRIEYNFRPWFIDCFEGDSMSALGGPGGSNYFFSLEQDPYYGFPEVLHLNPVLAVGKAWLTRNRNIFMLRAEFLFSTKSDVVGSWSVYQNSSRYSYGSYDWKSSYAGLSFSYRIVTGKNKK